MELIEIIKKRRSVRKFTDEKISDDELNFVLEAAGKSPSWSNTQVWEFIIIRDKDLIKQVTDTYSEFNPARKCSASASVLIAVCAKTGVSGCWEGKPLTKYNEWFMFDLGIAVQSLVLAAWEKGIGTVVVGLLDHDKCGRLLNVPEGYTLAAVLPLGKNADPEKTGPAKRNPDDFIHINNFGIKRNQ